jgi:hypothetical protein
MLHVSMNCANIEYMYMVSHVLKRVRVKKSHVNSIFVSFLSSCRLNVASEEMITCRSSKDIHQAFESCRASQPCCLC